MHSELARQQASKTKQSKKWTPTALCLVFSFSFPSLCSDVLAGTGNHTFAAAKCPENYQSLSEALKPVFDEINELISEN